MMLFLAALQQVPRELYEAAALDNASRWRTLWRITLPSIRRTFVLVIDHRDRAAVPAVRPGAADDAGRAEQRLAADRAVHLRSRLQALGPGLCGAAASEVLFGLILIAAMAQYCRLAPQGGRHERASWHIVGRATRRPADPRRSSSLLRCIMMAPMLWVDRPVAQGQRRADGRHELGVPRAVHAQELRRHPRRPRRCSAGCSTA